MGRQLPRSALEIVGFREALAEREPAKPLSAAVRSHPLQRYDSKRIAPSLSMTVLPSSPQSVHSVRAVLRAAVGIEGPRWHAKFTV